MIIKHDCRMLTYLLILVMTASTFVGCGKIKDSVSNETSVETETVVMTETGSVSDASETTSDEVASGNAATDQMAELNGNLTLNMPDDKYRTCYEVFVYAFADSNGDGIGDLQGLISKLDVINDGDPTTDQDLGYNEIWLMPICPSPTYHKYDVTDYMAIDPAYGTMEDFDLLVSECHKRGINLIVDTVINHTSSEHPWFLEASKYIKSLGAEEEPDVEACPYVDYYRFSRTKEAGYEPLPGSSWYYEARFWSGMPDLNLQSTAVRSELEEMTKFWIDHGVDGFRMDAVTSYETDHHDQNIEILRWFHDMAVSIDEDTYIVGECWTGSSTYSQYYRSGCDSFFDFDFSGSEGVIAKTVLGSRKASSYGEALMKEEELYASENPTYINAPFYTNHDMARSAGYYAKDSERRVKLAGALNLLMPGNAFTYYGEELGMKGSGKDENKRLPMGWSESDPALTKTVSGADYSSDPYPFGRFEEQLSDPTSVLNYYKEAVRIRNAFPVIARGKTEIIDELSGDDICALMRKNNNTGDDILILINTGSESIDVSLSGSAQAYKTLSAVLLTGDEAVSLANGTVTLPAMSIAIMTR